MAKRNSKAQQKREAKFLADLQAYFVLAGATEPESCGKQVMQTPLGPLDIRVFDDWVHTCFVAVKAAHPWTVRHARMECNPYSGKWNFHFWNNETPDVAISHIGHYIGKLLAYQPTDAEIAAVAAEVREHDERMKMFAAELDRLNAERDAAQKVA